jgi:hypothetical protein
VGPPGGLEPHRRAAARTASQIPETRRWDAARLIGGERDCPADPPSRREFLRWYAHCLAGVLGGAALLAGLTGAVVGGWQRWRMRAGHVVERRNLGRWVRAVFALAAIALGVVWTWLGNRFSGEFVFTWPAGLFAVQQIVLGTVFWAGRHREVRAARWLPVVAALILLAACVGYYDLCRRCDLAMMWLFLVGLMPSWPRAVPAAYQTAVAVRPCRDMVGAAIAFTAYYWFSAAYAWWWLGA